MSNNKKRLSPFSVDFWIAKGFSPEDALYQRNSRRPINWEYWVEKGLSKENAIEKAKETKDYNNKKGAKKASSRSKQQLRESSIRCVEYWIKKGFNEKEAQEKIKEVQTTNTIEKYEKKYGKNEGVKKFKERNENWSSLIESKELDKNAINAEKLLKKYGSIKKVSEVLKKTRNMEIPISIKCFKEKILRDKKQNPFLNYYYPEKLVDIYPKVVYNLLQIQNPVSFMSEFCEYSGKEYYGAQDKRSFGYRKWLNDGRLLRSSHEIKFYDLLMENNITDFEVDGYYEKNTRNKMRYDFKVGNHYIEIAPMYGENKTYTEKMDFKKQNYGALILTSVEEYNEFILSYMLQTI
jgi:hypothetical protein